MDCSIRANGNIGLGCVPSHERRCKYTSWYFPVGADDCWMEGVFGKWDWVANGVLHGAYHFHQPWGLLGSIVSGVFLYTFPSKRFRSTWMGIIVHSGQSVLFLFLMLGLVLDLA